MTSFTTRISSREKMCDYFVNGNHNHGAAAHHNLTGLLQGFDLASNWTSALLDANGTVIGDPGAIMAAGWPHNQLPFDVGTDAMPTSTSPAAASILSTPEFESVVYEFFLHGICLPVVGLFGLVGNGLSMFILSRPQMRSSMNCCLLGLASCDMVLIVCCLLLFAVPSVHSFTGLFEGYYRTFHHLAAPWLYPTALVAQTGSIYITMTVTLERYIAVCLPLRARSLCTYGRSKVYLLVIVLFSIAYNIPRFFEMSVKRVCSYIEPEEEDVFGATGTPDSLDVLHQSEQQLHVELMIFPSALRENDVYVQVYIHWIYLIVMFVIPFSCLVVLNIFIFVQVWRASKERMELTSSQKRELGLATMILVVVLVFLACNTLAFIVNILEIYSVPAMNYLTPVSNLLVMVNSSANFIIYCIFGQKFQKIFIGLICPHKPQPIRMRWRPADFAANGELSGGRMSIASTYGGEIAGGGTRGRVIHGHHYVSPASFHRRMDEGRFDRISPPGNSTTTFVSRASTGFTRDSLVGSTLRLPHASSWTK